MTTDPGRCLALIHIGDDSAAEQIHAVLQAAYALEAALVACSDFPPLRESLADLLRSSDRFLAARRAGVIVAALSFAHDSSSTVITRLGVSPAHLRQGIATELLTNLERRLPPMTHLTVSTAQANTPAIRLYERFGYAVAGRSVSPEGISLLHFSKRVRG